MNNWSHIDTWNIMSQVYFRWRDTKSLGAGIMFFLWDPNLWDREGYE